MNETKKYFCFVGIPLSNMMMSMSANIDDKGSDAAIEETLDSMTNALDGTGKAKLVWATYDAKKTSFEKACADFGNYMKFCKSKMAHISE